MFKYFRLFLLIGLISACTTTPPAPLSGDRLPEPVEEVGDLVQWQEYCLRVEWVDPACEEVK